MISVGSLSVVAAISFLIGKLWSSSEAVFEKRQAAYEGFLKLCPHSTEVLAQLVTELNDDLMVKIREAYSAAALYASPQVEKLMTNYLVALGDLIGSHDGDWDRAEAHALNADAVYSSMLEAMRRDSLGYTWFGIAYRIDRWKNPKTSAE